MDWIVHPNASPGCIVSPRTDQSECLPDMQMFSPNSFDDAELRIKGRYRWSSEMQLNIPPSPGCETRKDSNNSTQLQHLARILAIIGILNCKGVDQRVRMNT